MQTEKVWQDSCGYIWIGTLSGFSRFDGHELTPFLEGHRVNIISFAEVNGSVHALGFRRQWLVNGDKPSMQPLDPDKHWQENRNYRKSSQHPFFFFIEEGWKKRKQGHGFLLKKS